MDRARPLLPAVKLASDPYEAMEGADGVIIATEWGEFATLDLTRVASTLAEPVLIDLRNLYDPDLMVAAGLHYISVGRPPPAPNQATRSSPAAARSPGPCRCAWRVRYGGSRPTRCGHDA